MKKLLYIFMAMVMIMSFSSCDENDNNAITSNETNTNIETEKENKKTHDVDTICNEVVANSNGIYTTQKHIYSIDNFAVKRYDKETLSSSLITDDMSSIVGLTDDTVYYIEQDPTAPRLYKLTDKMDSPEYLYDLSNDAAFYMSGKYIYSISQNGTIIKHINSSKKYDESAEILFQGTNGIYKFYNDTIYMISNTESTVTCFSLKDNTYFVIPLEGEFKSGGFGSVLQNSGVYISNNKLIYVDMHSDIYCVNLDSGESTQISAIKPVYYFVANGTIYAADYNKTCCINIESGEVYDFALTKENSGMFSYCSTLNDTGNGMIYSNDSNRLIVCDYDGNVISEIIK